METSKDTHALYPLHASEIMPMSAQISSRWPFSVSRGTLKLVFLADKVARISQRVYSMYLDSALVYRQNFILNLAA